MDFENRNFVTEYRGNYVRHKFSPVVKYGKVQDFKDPIAESFKDYLSTGKENDEKIENYQNFMERLVCFVVDK
ncbi:hypothetical protein WA026_013879 [Henosepilachna vigintioctopunctata]|uniref:Uncharacterized protein n=1 Tax=Henosepilachna vigintioctopunctata TaxID=420089 RepID=A0AAW1U776_9CUCU